MLSAPIVAALEHTWNAIRARHPDLPAVVMVLASGSDGAPAGWLKLGHFAAMRWQHQTDQDLMPEVFVGGEGLARGPIQVLGTLLHEATHALAHVRGVKDTSRQGRYHNQRFADLAHEMGLQVAKIDPIGWSDTRVTEQTALDYAEVIARLAEAITIVRRTEAHVFAGGPSGGGEEDGDNAPASDGGDTLRRPRLPNPDRPANGNGQACMCECGRRIRVAPTVLAAAPITCGACGTDFTPA